MTQHDDHASHVSPSDNRPSSSDSILLAKTEIEQLRRLERVSLVEACTLILLVCVAVPLKHVAHWPYGVRWLGPVHGIAFAAYAWTVVQTIAGEGWTRRDAARLVAVAFIPFAGFTNLALVSRRIAVLNAVASLSADVA